MSKRQRIISLQPRDAPVAPMPLVVPLHVPSVQPPSTGYKDRMSSLPSDWMLRLVCPFFDDAALLCFQAASRTSFHRVQQFVRDQPWSNLFHVRRLKRYYEQQGWKVRLCSALASNDDYRKAKPTDWDALGIAHIMDPVQMRGHPAKFAMWIQGLIKRRQVLIAYLMQKHPVLDVFWTTHPLASLLLVRRADIALDEAQMRVLVCACRQFDAWLASLDPKRHRVLHATPHTWGGPLVSRMVVLQPSACDRVVFAGIASN